MKLFDKLHSEGNTIILVIHERDIADYAHRIISIRDGNRLRRSREKPHSRWSLSFRINSTLATFKESRQFRERCPSWVSFADWRPDLSESKELSDKSWERWERNDRNCPKRRTLKQQGRCDNPFIAEDAQRSKIVRRSVREEFGDERRPVVARWQG